MNSRNGYAATATRWRGSVGNVNAGAELAATWCERRYVAAKIPEHCWTNCLRVVDFMRESLPEMASKSPETPLAPNARWRPQPSIQGRLENPLGKAKRRKNLHEEGRRL